MNSISIIIDGIFPYIKRNKQEENTKKKIIQGFVTARETRKKKQETRDLNQEDIERGKQTNTLLLCNCLTLKNIAMLYVYFVCYFYVDLCIQSQMFSFILL